MCQPNGGDAVDDPPEHVEFGRTAEVGHEVEAGAADADVVEPADVGVGERLVDHGDAGVPAVAASDGVDHRGVVGAVALACTNTARRQPEPMLEPLELVDARIGRGVGAVGGEREALPRGRTRGSARRTRSVAG